MSKPKIIKTNLSSYTSLIPIMESINFQDVTKSLDPVSVRNHFSITDIPDNWKDIALEFPSATLVFDLAGSSISIRDRGAISYVTQNQEIFSKLTDLVYEYEGIIEKFPGDGISMHFPLFDSKSSNQTIERAFNAMCQMINYLEKEQGLKRSQFRFTLTYGKDTVVTKFGNKKHEELISIGHAVNVAHKLEKYVKDEHCFIGLDELCHSFCIENIEPKVEMYYLNSGLRREPKKSEKWYGVKY